MTDVPEELQFRSREEGGAAPEPMAFTLNGERFECLPVLPATRVIKHELNISAADGRLYLEEVLGYFRKAMTPEEWERFYAFIDSPDQEVSLEVLGEMMQKVHMAYVKRPTKPDSASPAGPGTTGDTSMDASPSEESTSEPSMDEGS